MSGYDEVVGYRSWEVGCYLSKWIWHYIKESIQKIEENWRSLSQGEIDLLLLVGSLILNYNFLLLFYTKDNYSNFLKPESLLSAVVKSRSHPYLFTNVILFNMRESMYVAQLTKVSNWLVYSHRRIYNSVVASEDYQSGACLNREQQDKDIWFFLPVFVFI